MKRSMKYQGVEALVARWTLKVIKKANPLETIPPRNIAQLAQLSPRRKGINKETNTIKPIVIFAAPRIPLVQE